MSGYYGLIELILLFAIVLGLGFWELRNVRRATRQAAAQARGDAPSSVVRQETDGIEH